MKTFNKTFNKTITKQLQNNYEKIIIIYFCPVPLDGSVG